MGDEKRYDPRDTTLKFVSRPDDLDPLRKHHKLIEKRLLMTSVSNLSFNYVHST